MQSNRVQGVLTFHYIRWEGMPMNFTFQDLMSFGTFILALLSFIFIKIKKK